VLDYEGVPFEAPPNYSNRYQNNPNSDPKKDFKHTQPYRITLNTPPQMWQRDEITFVSGFRPQSRHLRHFGFLSTMLRRPRHITSIFRPKGEPDNWLYTPNSPRGFILGCPQAVGYSHLRAKRALILESFFFE